MAPFARAVWDGARRCVVEVGGVKPGDNVLILNETGPRVEERAVQALAAVAEMQGANVSVLWTPELLRSWWDDVPKVVLAAFEAADVVIHNHYTIGRPHKPIHRAIYEKGVRFVRNYATTERVLASDWARFPMPLYISIERTLTERLLRAKTYRVVNPEGTDLSGECAGLMAFAAGTSMNETVHREFPPGNHIPVTSRNSEGVIMSRSTYAWGARLWGLPQTVFEEPVKLTIEKNRVVKVAGGLEADLLQRGFEYIAERGNVGDETYNVDSWHTGLHPKAFVPEAPQVDPDLWWHLSHHHPDWVHFHIGGDPGRDYGTPYMTHLSALFFRSTVYLDGEKWLDRGRFTVLDDPEVRGLASEYGDPDELLSLRTLWLPQMSDYASARE